MRGDPAALKTRVLLNPDAFRIRRMSTKPQTAYNYCALALAPYACIPEQTKGRLYAEEESGTRTPFQRDRDRIIHTKSCRRALPTSG